MQHATNKYKYNQQKERRRRIWMDIFVLLQRKSFPKRKKICVCTFPIYFSRRPNSDIKSLLILVIFILLSLFDSFFSRNYNLRAIPAVIKTISYKRKKLTTIRVGI